MYDLRVIKIKVLNLLIKMTILHFFKELREFLAKKKEVRSQIRIWLKNQGPNMQFTKQKKKKEKRENRNPHALIYRQLVAPKPNPSAICHRLAQYHPPQRTAIPTPQLPAWLPRSPTTILTPATALALGSFSLSVFSLLGLKKLVFSLSKHTFF